KLPSTPRAIQKTCSLDEAVERLTLDTNSIRRTDINGISITTTARTKAHCSSSDLITSRDHQRSISNHRLSVHFSHDRHLKLWHHFTSIIVNLPPLTVHHAT